MYKTYRQSVDANRQCNDTIYKFIYIANTAIQDFRPDRYGVL